VSQEWLAKTLGGRYAIQRLLGRGGTAAVFLATDLATDTPVAIKVFRPELAATLGTRRFHREIAFVRRLDHPNILPVLASDDAGPLPYFVTPYAGGGSLAARLAAAGRLSLDQALPIARQVAAALDHAHARNVLHRDIKPGNILFDGPQAVVCDFGIARAIEAASTDDSSSGFVLGTPAYMSPEQARGVRPLDGRSDVYALGCVVYEMLAGEPPFTGPTVQAIVARQAQGRPPRLRIVRPDVPAHVEAAIEDALAKDPPDRLASGGAFARALAGGA
jgi:serine/threonine-protein kinase